MPGVDRPQHLEDHALPGNDRIALGGMDFRQEVIQEERKGEFLRSGIYPRRQGQHQRCNHQHQQAFDQRKGFVVHSSTSIPGYGFADTSPAVITNLAFASDNCFSLMYLSDC